MIKKLFVSLLLLETTLVALLLLVIVVAGVFASRTSFVLAASPASHPELDHPRAAGAANILREAIDRSDSVDSLKASATRVIELLGQEHYVSRMLCERIASVRSATPEGERELRASIGQVIESLGFRPLMEAALPEGFPPFTPLHSIEIKLYPDYRLAQADMVSQSRSENGAFRSLFKHIKRNDIAMTAPVQFDYTRADGILAKETMSFLYRRTGLGTTGVDSSDSKVQVIDLPARDYLSLGVRGPVTQAGVMSAHSKLLAWLAAHSDEYEADGSVRAMGYNSPFIPRDRQFFEVQIPIRNVVAAGGQYDTSGDSE